MFIVYWIINKEYTKTYVGYSGNLNKRLSEHRNKKVVSTRNFEDFKVFILEMVDNKIDAKEREKHWKSRAGKKQLKVLFPKYTK